MAHRVLGYYYHPINNMLMLYMEESSAYGSIGGLTFGLLATLFYAVNHKRVRSNCCGAKLEASLDVENTTPPHDALKISVPPVDVHGVGLSVHKEPTELPK